MGAAAEASLSPFNLGIEKRIRATVLNDFEALLTVERSTTEQLPNTGSWSCRRCRPTDTWRPAQQVRQRCNMGGVADALKSKSWHAKLREAAATARLARRIN